LKINIKASLGLNELSLYFNQKSDDANFDSCLDAIFSLDQVKCLRLRWNRLTCESILTVLSKKGKKTRMELFCLYGGVLSQTDILEICSYLPALREWRSSTSTITISVAKEWKRICPHLATVYITGLTEKVKKTFEGLRVRIVE
jgi:hypothetical protein